jgi:hypothetical protein
MKQNESINQQFIALRREIEGRQARLFWLVVIGLLALPFLGHALLDTNNRTWITLPLLVLVLIILFLTQQSHLMRTGRYIREFIEKNMDFSPGWETWLESRRELRLMDLHFSACFIVVFFAYYFLSVAIALHRLWMEALEDPSGTYWCDFFGAASVYTTTTIWAFVALICHWRSATGTAPDPRTARASSVLHQNPMCRRARAQIEQES